MSGRKIRTLLPCSENNLIPQWPDFTKLQNTEETQKLKQRFWFNKRHRAKPLSSLQPGDPVWLQENGKPASVIQHADTPRSYIVGTENGMLRRNRRDLIKNPQKEASNAGTEQSQPDHPETTELGVLPGQTRSGRVIRPPKKLDL